MNSTGNERADTLAKDASENGTSPKTKLPPFLQKRLPISISAVKQMIQEDINIGLQMVVDRIPKISTDKTNRPLAPLKQIPKNHEFTQS